MENIIRVNEVNTPAKYQQVPIDKAIELFLSECDIRDNSRTVYRRELRHFFQWIEDTGRTISQLSRADIIAFKDSMLNTHSNLTVAGYLVALRKFYEWAEGNKFVGVSTRYNSSISWSQIPCPVISGLLLVVGRNRKKPRDRSLAIQSAVNNLHAMRGDCLVPMRYT